MGDSYRSLALAEYVSRYYPPPLKVADVAGGNGTLNDILTRRGYDVVTIDPNLRMKYSGLKGEAVEFTAEKAREYDLIVGLHPDKATEEIVYSAKFRPTIIVPCCRHWTGREMSPTRSIRGTIEKYLGEHHISFVKERMPINGANIVYITLRS